MSDITLARRVVDLLKQTSTKEVLQSFLKSKGIPYSGSWEELLEKRIIPAINGHIFSAQDLIPLLSSAEEHGRQHVFLYRCTDLAKVKKMMDRKRVHSELRRRGEEELIQKTRVLEDAQTATFTEVRWDSASIDLALVIKEVETRKSHHPLEELVVGNILHKKYEIREQRAVNVARLHHTGLLEIRISARVTGSTKYKDDLRLFWARVCGLLELRDFTPVTFTALKARLISSPSEFVGKVRYSTSLLKNGDGTTMSVSSRGEDADLYGDAGASDGIKAFMAIDGHCEGSNFFFVKNSDLSKDVHIRLSGEVNEFAITAACNEEDYRYVLDEILRLNERVSGGERVA